MSKINLIIEREYVTRVRKKSFIITTLLMPIGMLILMILPTFIAMMDSSTSASIAVVDRTERFAQGLENTETITYSLMPSNTHEAGLKECYESGGFDAYMIIESSPAERDGVKIYSRNSLPMDVIDHTENNLKEQLRKEYLASYAGHSAEIDSLFAQVNNAKAHVTTINITDDGSEKEDYAEVGVLVSILTAMLIYMFVLITGTQVLQGIVEEKQNRIVEVLISSVKPFDLLMGKIIGIALVALTQIVIWIACGVIMMIAAAIIFGISLVGSGEIMMTQNMAQENIDPEMVTEVYRILQSINFIELAIYFVIFFIGGYLLYASLFAIVGATMDNAQEGSQLQVFIMIPLFASIYIAIHTMEDPNSALSFWSSLFPLTSPIIMMARIPFSVPTWQILLSIALLFATFILFMWIAARIYRVGILMYGKKPSFKELVKWFRQGE